MSLVLYNTLKRAKEPFVPRDPGHVGMYVCGPTVYDLAHIGNARPVIVFDVLCRLLRRRYEKVTYVRNITDVDDKINAAAKQNDEPIAALTARTTQAFHEDIAALNALPPDVEPRATEHIGEMIALIQVLLDRGHAYVAEGHVLFGVPSDPEYGKLSNRSRDEMIAGARVEVAPYKQDPADFVLWKPSPPDLPGWDSPWGRGRPGWHIECSAMSKKHLGETIDIHGGGVDLVFPHHENEVAQSECAHGTTFARYWVHNGFLTVNGEKMSKSLGNFITIRDALKLAPGEVIRAFMLGTHYRQPIDWTEDALKQARASLDRFYTALRNAADAPEEAADVDPEVEAALDDDLNTPLALQALHRLAGDLNKAASAAERARLKGSLLTSGDLLGLLKIDSETWFKGNIVSGVGTLRSGAATISGSGVMIPEEAAIERLIEARNAARKRKDFAEADRIRDELKSKGVVLEDSPKGTLWRRAG
ncbi:MAG: cysteine--tRNA ligase [Alphaproteobacteria bacterium]